MTEDPTSLLVPLGIITANEEGCAFTRVMKLVHAHDRLQYPEATAIKEISKKSKFTDTRLKMICAVNYRDVLEADRLCSFKIVAASSDRKLTAKIVPGPDFCLTHSCQSDPELKKLHTLTKRHGRSATEALGGGENTTRKRRVIALQENQHHAWKILNSKKMYEGDNHAKAVAHLKQWGAYEPTDIVELEGKHIMALQALMKAEPGENWATLLHELTEERNKILRMKYTFRGMGKF